MSDHDDHCFIAVPHGKSDDEHERIQGWVAQVMLPVAEHLKLRAEISVRHGAPTAITPEIREHLAFDKLAFFDLGGSAPTDPPNPNVMYELGIRHAFDLPSVVLAWKGQVLPFDISEHRLIIGERHFGTIESHRQRLLEFAQAALNGDFFKPMHAVRVARMDEQAIAASRDEALVAIAHRLEQMQTQVTAIAAATAFPGRAQVSDTLTLAGSTSMPSIVFSPSVYTNRPGSRFVSGGQIVGPVLTPDGTAVKKEEE